MTTSSLPVREGRPETMEPAQDPQCFAHRPAHRFRRGQAWLIEHRALATRRSAGGACATRRFRRGWRGGSCRVSEGGVVSRSCVCHPRRAAEAAAMASLLAKDAYLQGLARKICCQPSPEPQKRKSGNAPPGVGSGRAWWRGWRSPRTGPRSLPLD